MPHASYSWSTLDVKKNFIEIEEGFVLSQYKFNFKALDGTQKLLFVQNLSLVYNIYKSAKILLISIKNVWLDMEESVHLQNMQTNGNW